MTLRTPTVKQIWLMSHLLVICRTGTVPGQCHFGCIDNECNTHGVCTKECKLGYSGYKCEKCLLCVGQYCSDTGVCSLGCLEGYYGARCLYRCPTNCLPESCNRINGDCMQSCKEGYYGSRCYKQCPEHCTRCSRTRNSEIYCLSCSQGYHGRICELSCSTNCLFKTCNKNNGDCTYGCQGVRYYGSSCNQTCILKNSPCDHKCPPGYYGIECFNKCPSNCLRNTCNSLSGACPSGCSAGHYGPLCNKVCPGHCISCHQNLDSNNACIECDEGYYGPACEYTCQNCLSNMCDRNTGHCTKGCAEGRYGTNCSKQCPAHCLTCDLNIVIDKTCTTCRRGFYGPVCDKSCSEHCQYGLCDFVTGYCTTDCHEGYHGPDCDKQCPFQCLECDREFETKNTCITCKGGYYGVACQRSCSPRCINNTCSRKTGICLQECDDSQIRINCAEAISEAWTLETGSLVGVIALVGVISILTVTIICVVIRCRRTGHAAGSNYLTPVENANETNEERQTGGAIVENHNQTIEELDENYSESIAGHIYMEMDELGCFDINKHQERQSSDIVQGRAEQPHRCGIEESAYAPLDQRQHATEGATYESIC